MINCCFKRLTLKHILRSIFLFLSLRVSKIWIAVVYILPWSQSENQQTDGWINDWVKASLDSASNTQLLLFLYPFDYSSCHENVELLRSKKRTGAKGHLPEEQAEDILDRTKNKWYMFCVEPDVNSLIMLRWTRWKTSSLWKSQMCIFSVMSLVTTKYLLVIGDMGFFPSKSVNSTFWLFIGNNSDKLASSFQDMFCHCFISAITYPVVISTLYCCCTSWTEMVVWLQIGEFNQISALPFFDSVLSYWSIDMLVVSSFYILVLLH